jgi:tRNA threonylcarbamoyl adenosine modification protein YeaZ
MKLLAIDTALEACSVAVAGAGHEPLAQSEIVGRGHAERLFGMIAAVMDEAGIAFTDLDRIAVNTGPGSFTGVRVGVAAARGIALVVKCPVVGIGTLAVHAASARAQAGPVPVLAVLDARRGEIYGQRFAGDGAAVDAPRIARPEDFASELTPGEVVAGGGADSVLIALPEARRPRVVHRRSSPDIRVLAGLGARTRPAATAPRPLYLRPPDAKPQSDAGVARR